VIINNALQLICAHIAYSRYVKALVGIFDGLLVKYYASIAGYCTLLSPFIFAKPGSENATTADLTREYIRNRYGTRRTRAGVLHRESGARAPIAIARSRPESESRAVVKGARDVLNRLCMSHSPRRRRCCSLSLSTCVVSTSVSCRRRSPSSSWSATSSRSVRSPYEESRSGHGAMGLTAAASGRSDVQSIAGYTSRVSELLEQVNHLNQAGNLPFEVKPEAPHVVEQVEEGSAYTSFVQDWKTRCDAQRQLRYEIRHAKSNEIESQVVGGGELVVGEEIEFQGVDIVSPEGKLLVQDLNFKVPQGTNVMVTGELRHHTM
jgi:hypothetical protein